MPSSSCTTGRCSRQATPTRCSAIPSSSMPISDRRWSMLHVEDLVAGYGSITVLRGVSLARGSKELVSIVGANGAGKATLLRAVSGLVRPTGGRVRFDGSDVTGAPMHRIVQRGLVQVPEGRQLFPSLTV